MSIVFFVTVSFLDYFNTIYCNFGFALSKSANLSQMKAVNLELYAVVSVFFTAAVHRRNLTLLTGTFEQGEDFAKNAMLQTLFPLLYSLECQYLVFRAFECFFRNETKCVKPILFGNS